MVPKIDVLETRNNESGLQSVSVIRLVIWYKIKIEWTQSAKIIVGGRTFEY